MGKYRRDYQTDIIVVGWNNFDLTTECLRSVQKNTLAEHYQITYIDNGSSMDGLVKHILVPFLSLNTVILPFNHGFVRGANIGLAMSLLTDSEYVLLLNNDVTIPDGDTTWLQRLIVPMLEDTQVGAVGAVTDRTVACQKRKAVGEGYAYAPVLIGFCMLLRKKAIRKVGLFDERFTPGNYEDFDYSIRLDKAGWRMVVAENVWLHHKAHSSFRELNKTEKFSEILDGNRAKLKEKWTPIELEKVGVHELEGRLQDTATDSDA